MKKALTLAIAWLALGATGFAQDPASRPTKEERDAKLVELAKLYDSVAEKQAVGNPKAGLAAADAAVDGFQKLFSSLNGTADPEAIELYKQLIGRSDAMVATLETAEYEAQIPWRDMLSPKERSPWGHSQGCKLTWGESSATIEGVPIDRPKVTGVASILPPKAMPWNDFVIELEFTVVSGEVEMYLRYWPDKRSYLIRFGPKEHYELNKRYAVTISVKGSTITLANAPKGTATDKIHLATSRTGGIGLGVGVGSKVEISKLQLKVLR